MPGATAVLTALLTPSYTAVPDSIVATKLAYYADREFAGRFDKV